MSQVNTELSFLREQLLAKKTSENLTTEVQGLLTRITALEEEKTKLGEVLESAKEEATNLRRGLEEHEQEVSSAHIQAHTGSITAVNLSKQGLFVEPSIETPADERA